MLLSIVIQCSAKETCSLRSASGRGLHGFWFKQLHAIDAPLAERLHDDVQRQPFTLSPLMDLPLPYKNSTVIQRGQKTWFRVCSLTEELSTFLLEKWVNSLPDEINIADTNWRVEGVAFSPDQHAWARTSSYSDLLKVAYDLSDLYPVWHFHFAPPVTFHRSVGHFPFPLPDALVKSWLQRWQRFSSIQKNLEFSEEAKTGIAINAYELKTVPFSYGSRTLIGAVGEFSLRALHLSPEEKSIFHTLAHYSFYCGSGSKTTQGMGQTKVEI
jgi:CRISPR-associated endoribonuclease Cas6